MPGTWGDFGSQLPYPPDVAISDPAYPTYGEAPPWWAILGPSIITTTGTVARDIFAPVGSTQAAYGAQRPVVLPTYGTGRVYQQTTPGGGVGIGIDGQGIRLSDGSHIGWLPIAAVVLGIVLLQSQGLSRRRNPSARKRNPQRHRRSSRRRR